MGVLQYYVNFQSSLRSLIVICDSLIRGDQGPPNYCLHRVARMLRPALGPRAQGASAECVMIEVPKAR